MTPAKIATAAGLLVASAVLVGILAAGAAPGRPTPPSGVKTFAPVCVDGVDSRSDPAWVGASLAGDQCRAPRLPPALNGLNANRAQVVAEMAATQRYLAGAQAFERCIGDFLVAQKRGAAKPVTNAALVVMENHRIVVSERNRKAAAERVRMTIEDFNAYGSDCPD